MQPTKPPPSNGRRCRGGLLAFASALAFAVTAAATAVAVTAAVVVVTAAAAADTAATAGSEPADEWRELRQRVDDIADDGVLVFSARERGEARVGGDGEHRERAGRVGRRDVGGPATTGLLQHLLRELARLLGVVEAVLQRSAAKKSSILVMIGSAPVGCSLRW